MTPNTPMNALSFNKYHKKWLIKLLIYNLIFEYIALQQC